MTDRTTGQPDHDDAVFPRPEQKSILNILKGNHYTKLPDSNSLSSKKSWTQKVKSKEVGHTPEQDPTRPEYSIFGGSVFSDNRGSRG
jgi:hypothetical protein